VLLIWYPQARKDNAMDYKDIPERPAPVVQVKCNPDDGAAPALDGLNTSPGAPVADGKAPNRRRCGATTKAGKVCNNYRVPGHSGCWFHAVELDAERSAAGRRGWATVNRKNVDAADLVRIKTPKTTDDVVRSLADVARAVMGGSITPNAAREVISALNSIAKVRTDETTLSELHALNMALADRGQGAERLLELLDTAAGDRHE